MTPPSRVYISPPSACATVAEIVSLAGGEMSLKRKTPKLNYLLPVGGSAEVKNYFRSEMEVDLPAEFLARLPGGRVFGSGNVLSRDGRLLARDVSPDFGKPFAEHWLLSYPKITGPVPLAGTTAVLATTLGDGYSHWLLDELPRWLSFDFSACDAVIAHAKNRFTHAALSHLNFKGKRIEASRAAHFACEELLVPSLVAAPGFPSPDLAASVNAFADTLRPKSDVAPERIYLSRAKSRRRRVSNEDQLWAQLEPLGFVRLFLEDLEWTEQIAVFREVKVLVAPHGAGLANLVFSRAGTRVVEFFNPDFVDGVYWRLAAIRGLDYRPVVAASNRPLRHLLSANREDFGADISSVLGAVSG